MQELHTVENTSELTSDFLRVEFKTDPRDQQTMRGRFYSEPDPTGTRIERLAFDSEGRLAVCWASGRVDRNEIPGQ